MKKKIMITVASLAALELLSPAISTSPAGRLLVIAISAELWYCSA